MLQEATVMNTCIKFFIGALFLLLPFAVSAKDVLTRDLRFGMYGSTDVVVLQKFLRDQGYLSLAATGNYLNGTIQAVKKFQKAHGLNPIGGYFGPESRRVANEILAAQQAVRINQQGGNLPTGEAGRTVSPESSASASATTSPYKGKIFFDGIQWGGGVESEYLVITNRTDKERILITGFSVTTQHGQAYLIPLGFALPGFSATPLDPIFLEPRNRVIISVGKQDRYMNFRENMCTGYFDETARFSPGLSHRCPVPNTVTLHNLSDRCIQALSGVSGCRTGPQLDFPDPECASYIADNLNYAGCVAHERSRPNFYNDQWLVWMQRTIPFFNKRFEIVTLKDSAGKVVDTYQYGY
jgi:peptidoglycan hydrolase-like protein with peptidoglycan-binding domain